MAFLQITRTFALIMNLRHFYIATSVLIMTLIGTLGAKATESTADQQMADDDSLCVSLLTCSPGTEVYTHFGHTAIRTINYTKGFDIVFNYGCFDYRSDNFVMKFILGKTDYMIEAEPADYFFFRYDRMGTAVTEQILNLSSDEKNKLLNLLLENARPENQTYRYNWLYDNCTTRARDMIERAANSKITYNRKTHAVTPRRLLHRCLSNSCWTSFGIDMLLGTEIDHMADRRVLTFIPAEYMAELEMATAGNGQKLVSKTQQVLAAKAEITNIRDTRITPALVFGLLLLLLFTMLALDILTVTREKVRAWQFIPQFISLLVIGSQGVAGLIVSFLYFFSEHPAVDSNWLVIVFNPLPLLYFLIHSAVSIYKRCKGLNGTHPNKYLKNAETVYLIASIIINGLFIIAMPLLPQAFDSAMYITIMALLVAMCTMLRK